MVLFIRCSQLLLKYRKVGVLVQPAPRGTYAERALLSKQQTRPGSPGVCPVLRTLQTSSNYRELLNITSTLVTSILQPSIYLDRWYRYWSILYGQAGLLTTSTSYANDDSFLRNGGMSLQIALYSRPWLITSDYDQTAARLATAAVIFVYLGARDRERKIKRELFLRPPVFRLSQSCTEKFEVLGHKQSHPLHAVNRKEKTLR
ncbi:hypothetical protein RRG08_045483 [Elysia crispata]|uniref:Uncharacterized protein n=1 Tax=Elysia crispata TaxID=231223 RepID=A0AAE1AED2_9GAST|nr:hypothetical protein RRG08_045483 [Elysia crispata]